MVAAELRLTVMWARLRASEGGRELLLAYRFLRRALCRRPMRTRPRTTGPPLTAGPSAPCATSATPRPADCTRWSIRKLAAYLRKSTAAWSGSVARRYGACSPAAVLPSSEPRPGRSPPTPNATPSSTALSTSWSGSRTEFSRSTSSVRSASGPPAARVGAWPGVPRWANPDRGPLRAIAAVRDLQLPLSQPHRTAPGPARLSALAQPPRPRPRRPCRPTA